MQIQGGWLAFGLFAFWAFCFSVVWGFYGVFPSRDGSNKLFFKEMSQELVQQLENKENKLQTLDLERSHSVLQASYLFFSSFFLLFRSVFFCLLQSSFLIFSFLFILAFSLILLSSESLSVGHVRTGRLVSDEFDSLISNVRENPRRGSGTEQIRILLERQREQILADCQAEIRKHEFQADYDRRSIPKLNEVIESQIGEIYRVHQGDEQLRRDQQLLHEQFLAQNQDLREAHEKSQ